MPRVLYDGNPLGPDTVWWDELTEPVPDDMRREDGHRTFGLMELAVRGPWRGQVVARRLHLTLLDAVGAERVLLNVGEQGGVGRVPGVGIPQDRRGAATGARARTSMT